MGSTPLSGLPKFEKKVKMVGNELKQKSIFWQFHFSSSSKWRPVRKHILSETQFNHWVFLSYPWFGCRIVKNDCLMKPVQKCDSFLPILDFFKLRWLNKEIWMEKAPLSGPVSPMCRDPGWTVHLEKFHCIIKIPVLWPNYKSATHFNTLELEHIYFRYVHT